jgi:hypothetical protein
MLRQGSEHDGARIRVEALAEGPAPTDYSSRAARDPELPLRPRPGVGRNELSALRHSTDARHPGGCQTDTIDLRWIVPAKWYRLATPGWT